VNDAEPYSSHDGRMKASNPFSRNVIRCNTNRAGRRATMTRVRRIYRLMMQSVVPLLPPCSTSRQREQSPPSVEGGQWCTDLSCGHQRDRRRRWHHRHLVGHSHSTVDVTAPLGPLLWPGICVLTKAPVGHHVVQLRRRCGQAVPCRGAIGLLPLLGLLRYG
jgi:hypothetical protein